ncbi:tetratricopeptide repeat protein [Myxococcota bacterium]|nr:tetratricopeptide repeat protein [Myxococcota bacterium]
MGWASMAQSPTPYHRYIEQIEKKLKTSPNDPRLLTILGRLYEKAGEAKQAKQLFQRALRANRRYSHAKLGLARLALSQQRLLEADRLLRAVLRRDPRHAPAWSLYAESLRLQARVVPPSQQKRLLERSLQAHQKAIRLAPQKAPMAYRYAVLLLGMNKIPDAHVAFLRTVALDPQHPCYQLGLATVERMMTPHTKQLYQRLSRWYPLCPHPLLRQAAQPVLETSVFEQAQILRKKKRNKQGEQILRELIRLEPKTLRGYMFLAMTLLQDQQCTQAQAVLRALLQHHPNHAPAQKLLKRPKTHPCL